MTFFLENVLDWGAKYRKIFAGNMLLHARPNTRNTFKAYFPKHNQTVENILHLEIILCVAKHSHSNNELLSYNKNNVNNRPI